MPEAVRPGKQAASESVDNARAARRRRSTVEFGRTVVLRYRYELEARRLAPATINLRLAAVRRLAYEASDNGLLSPDLAASIRRVKGTKKLGTRLGNWLTCAQGRRLPEAPDRRETKGKRNHAILALLLGCGLRRAELIGLKLTHLQQRDDHWAIIDLFGKGGHVRTVPVPGWVKAAVDEWLNVARVEEGLIFSCVTHSGTVWGSGISEKVVCWVVRQCAKKAAIDRVAQDDDITVLTLTRVPVGELAARYRRRRSPQLIRDKFHSISKATYCRTACRSTSSTPGIARFEPGKGLPQLLRIAKRLAMFKRLGPVQRNR